MPADLTTVLGRLLSDPALRGDLRRDPAAAARALDADPNLLAGLDPEGLDLQAATLVDKRHHEVSKLLPRTIHGLGAGAQALFRDYAAGCWPEGHHRHAQDALGFGRFLEERKAPRSRWELNRLRFALGKGRFALRLVPDAVVGGRARRALQILFRLRGGVRSFALYVGF